MGKRERKAVAQAKLIIDITKNEFTHVGPDKKRRANKVFYFTNQFNGKKIQIYLDSPEATTTAKMLMLSERCYALIKLIKRYIRKDLFRKHVKKSTLKSIDGALIVYDELVEKEWEYLEENLEEDNYEKLNWHHNC